MSSLKRAVNLVEYEWKRTLAKKKFFLLMALALLLQVGMFLLFRNLPPEMEIPSEVKATMWLTGLLSPQGLFIPLIAIIIAGSAMAEEYEHGRGDLLLTKPITKIEYMFGKYLGGLSILSVVIALMAILPVGLGWAFFGPQKHLQLVPVMYVTLIYANLLVFSLAFMFSEVIRSSTAAIIATIGIYMGSTIVGSYLSIMHGITGEALYQTISKALPNWSTSNFPTFIAEELMNPSENPFISITSGEIPLAAVIIAGYTITSLVITYFRFKRSDIENKVGG